MDPKASIVRLGPTNSGSRGFTVVELVVVIALLGILSAVAVSRMTRTDLFTQRAAVDELAAALRQAHKRAIAQRGSVFITVDTVNRVVRFCRDATANCPNPMQEPGSSAALLFTAPAGATLAVSPSSPVTFSIDNMGSFVGPTGASTDIVLDSPAATATARIWTETGLTETLWTTK